MASWRLSCADADLTSTMKWITPEADRERLAIHRGLSGAEAQHGSPAGGARPGGHGREALARLRAQVPPDPRREHPHHRLVRCPANPARRRLCLPRRLADRPVGPAPLADALQRALTGGLRFGAGLAPLAGAVARFISVSRLERVVVAYDLHRCRHLAQGTPAHHGHRRPIHGAPRADDARAAGGRMAHHALRLDPGRAICPAACASS